MRRATVVCEECGTRLTVTDRQIGVLGECPRCGEIMEIRESHFEGATVVAGPAGVVGPETPLLPGVDAVLDGFRFLREGAEAFGAHQGLLSRLGLIGTLVAGLVALLHLAVLALRSGNVSWFGLGVGALLGAIVLHYLTARFLHAMDALIGDRPREAGVPAFMDSMGLVAAVGGIVLLAVAVAGAGMGLSLLQVLLSVAGALLLAQVTVCFLNPRETMNLRRPLRDRTAGEGALAIVASVLRSALLLGPLALVLGVLGGVSWMIVSMIVAWSGVGGGQGGFVAAAATVTASALVPPALYLGYVFAMLVVDFLNAVFRIAAAR